MVYTYMFGVRTQHLFCRTNSFQYFFESSVVVSACTYVGTYVRNIVNCHDEYSQCLLLFSVDSFVLRCFKHGPTESGAKPAREVVCSC